MEVLTGGEPQSEPQSFEQPHLSSTDVLPPYDAPPSYDSVQAHQLATVNEPPQTTQTSSFDELPRLDRSEPSDR